MGTKVTSSSGSVLEEPEIQKLQMQAKIFKENSLNKLNALKSTTQLLERQTFSGCPLYQQAFAQLFGDGVRTFKFQLSQHMNNLETQLNAETLHEMDSKSALSVIKEQFERFINSDLLKPLDIYSRSFSSDREKEQVMEQELKITLKKLSERQFRFNSAMFQEEVLPKNPSSTDTPLEQVQNNDENNVFANERQHSEKNAAEFLNQMHDELVKKSLLTKSQFEGQLKEKTKVISDLKVKEEKDIDKMIEMDKQLKFLNEIVYTRNQSIQTIHMLAPKCSTYNGRPTFANPRYLKKAQSDKPCLYEIPYDNSDHANRFAPDREETMTLANESRSKLNKDYVKPYDYTRQNSLYEIFKAPSLEYLYQLERAKEVRKTIEIVDQAWFKHTSDYFRVPTAKDIEVLIKTLLMPLSIKTQNDSFRFEHELKTEMHEDYEYVKSLEKEVDELESEKADFSNIYDLLLKECVSKDVTCSYLHSMSHLNANTELQCMYLHKVKECECLAQKLSKQTESVNKEVHNKLLKSFAKLENHSISLELALQQFQMQDKNIAISELKKLIKKCKGKSVETQFDKPSVVRQPNAQRIPKPSVLGKPTPFSNSPEMRSFQTKQSVNKTNVSDGLFKQVTQQNLPQNRKQAEIHSNVLKPGMYRISTTTTQSRTPQLPHASRNTNPHVSKSTGVNHTTSVSRPQLKCYQVKDKVVPNNSQVKFKKKEVEDHHRISSISKKTKSVTACNDSSKSRTLNVNAVCAECGKCVFNSNHDACVSRYLNDVNARTKKPKVVPISASKPKRKANKSVATPHKKTVASDTTIQKSKSYHKELYENTNQEWKWWIAKRCPSGYKWTQKPLRTKKIWMPKIRKEDVSTSISPTIDIVSRITNIVQLILFIVDSGCTKHMTGNLKLLCNFVEKFLGTVRFRNDQFAPILGYGDLIQGNVTIKWVYYVEGLNHNLFSVGQFCDADLEVAFRKSTCFVRDLQGNDLLTASPNQAWVMHRRLSHLYFDLHLLTLKERSVNGAYLKLKNVKINLCSYCEMVKQKRRGTDFEQDTHAYFKEEGIEHQTSTPRTPEQNGVVERRNRTLVEAARTMLSASKLPLSFWAEAVATACYTQNRSIIISTHDRRAYHIIK
ncbi:retrovirus-related pol polyprotein from transposon TNT 1-94 [Tanacetum coccineum]